LNSSSEAKNRKKPDVFEASLGFNDEVLTRQRDPVGKPDIERDSVLRSDCARDVPLAGGVFSEENVARSESYLSASLKLNLTLAAQCHDELPPPSLSL